jgi:hypothetical protein
VCVDGGVCACVSLCVFYIPSIHDPERRPQRIHCRWSLHDVAPPAACVGAAILPFGSTRTCMLSMLPVAAAAAAAAAGSCCCLLLLGGTLNVVSIDGLCTAHRHRDDGSSVVTVGTSATPRCVVALRP